MNVAEGQRDNGERGTVLKTSQHLLHFATFGNMVVDLHVPERAPSQALCSQQYEPSSMQRPHFVPYEAYGGHSMYGQETWYDFNIAHLDDVAGKQRCSLNISACSGDMKHEEKSVVKDSPHQPLLFPSKPTSWLQEACCPRSGRALYDKVIQDDPCMCQLLVCTAIQDDPCT